MSCYHKKVASKRTNDIVCQEVDADKVQDNPDLLETGAFLQLVKIPDHPSRRYFTSSVECRTYYADEETG